MNGIILTILGALFALSLVGNVVLYRQCKAFYLREDMLRLDPLGRGEQPRTTDQGTGIHGVFFGDSRAKQWVAPNAAGYRFSNHGIADQTTGQVRLKTAAVLAEKELDMVVVEAGMNDIEIHSTDAGATAGNHGSLHCESTRNHRPPARVRMQGGDLHGFPLR